MEKEAPRRRRRNSVMFRRRKTLKRFLFTNSISLVTLLSFVFYAGGYNERFLRLEQVVLVMEARAEPIPAKLSAIETDLAHLKARAYERDHKAR